MYPDSEKYVAVILDKKVLDKVQELLVESCTEFRVVSSTDTENAWMLRDFAAEVEYDPSYNDSGCEF